MKTRHVLTAVAVTLLLMPVVVSFGALILIPLGLMLGAMLPLVALFSLPVLLAWIGRDPEQAAVRMHAPPSSRVVYTRW